MKKYYGAFVLEKEEKVYIYNPYIDLGVWVDKEKTLEETLEVNKSYLFEKNIFMDEVSGRKLHTFFVNKERYNFSEVTVTEAMSFACNLKCVYCMQQNTEHKVNEISAEERVKLWKKMLEIFGAERLNICLFGGEPFLKIDYIEQLMILAKENNIEIGRLFAVTNGTLCNDRIMTFINQYGLSSVQVTLDGPAEVHNKRRVGKEKNTYEIINNNIQRLLDETDVKIVINTVLDKQNHEYYEEMLDELIVKYGDYMYGEKTRIIFNLGVECHPVNKSEYTDENILEEKEYRDFFYDNMMKLANKGVAINMPFPAPVCILNYANDIVTGPDGSVYSCITAIGMEKFRIGTYEEVMNKTENFLMNSIITSERERGEGCKTCDYLPFCNGGCAYNQLTEEKKSSCQKLLFDLTIEKQIELKSMLEEIGPGIYRKVS